MLSHSQLFQLTTSRRGRQQHFELDAWQFVFQLTTSRGGRRKPFLFKQEEKPFQLTTSRGGRLLSCQALRCHWYFNSRPRKEVDISYCPRRAGLLLFQLTTSQGGRHTEDRCTAPDNNISTHDLTKRSTGCFIHLCAIFVISTHDLTKRSTVTVKVVVVLE